MKIFIAGIGSDMGTAIARSLEHNSKISELAGVDLYPPRRYLGRTQFKLFSIGESEKISTFLNEFSPDLIINFGVYEPGSRLDLRHARYATQTITQAIEEFFERSKTANDIKIITRSSICVYGFENPERVLDETSPLNPDTDYGEICCEVEARLQKISVNVTIIRSAPEIGAHVPHPLARILLQPWLPIQIRFGFSKEVGIPVTSPRDVEAMYLRCIFDPSKQGRVFHSVATANFTMSEAQQISKRIPIYSTGIGFGFLKQLSYFAGAPVDDHIEMFIRRGMKVDSTATRMHFKLTSLDSASEILRNLYQDLEKVIDSPTQTEASK